MGSPCLAASLLAVLLLPTGLSAPADTGCGYLPPRITRCLLASHMVRLCVPPYAGLQWGWFHLLVHRSGQSYQLKFCQGHRMPASPQKKMLGSHNWSEKSHPTSIPSPYLPHKRLRYRRTQPSAPGEVGSQRHGGPEFTFELLPEARVIRVTIPPGPEVSVRLCHQWTLECEELSGSFGAQKTVAGGHTSDLPYEFLLPCLCVEAAYLQEDTVRRKKCPFQNWPKAYASDLWKSVHFTDHSQHNQMVMALTLRCPLKLEAYLCQRQDQHGPCEDLPNATVRESDGWYALEKVDLHPQLCFKFYFENSSHVECPHQRGALVSWNVSMATGAQQLILHFSSRMHATFSAAWSHPGLGLDTSMSPVYSISQVWTSQGWVPVSLLIPEVWRSDVQFARKRLLCPDATHRRLGLLTLALLGLSILLGVAAVLTCRRRLLSGKEALGAARLLLSTRGLSSRREQQGLRRRLELCRRLELEA
uniref:Interleukin-17 receptor C/E N-terminal domain-containing protein n=1 Tax=Cavia porcellus TaxID=10141 RepID=A0A286XKL6_CAVPO